MLKILTIVGARPQIIKAGALSRAIRLYFSTQISETILHTGQHYDEGLSEVFFNELNIPKPAINLLVGSGNHGEQTSMMLAGIEVSILKEKPDCVVVYGDTNSTIAGALAASKLHIPVVHIEAGLRSFDKKMPEEINRILTDHVSSILFTPTQTGLHNLINEGFKNTTSSNKASLNTPLIYHCGDVMFDNSIYFSTLADKKEQQISELGINKNNFILLTVHRASNTDRTENLVSILSAVNQISIKEKTQVVFPLHPRTKSVLEPLKNEKVVAEFMNNDYIKIMPPASFLEMIWLEKNCKIAITDSGGVQKEAYFFNKPSIILRDETEWVELVQNGSSILAGAEFDKITDAFALLINDKKLSFPSIFGDGDAAEFICNKLIEHFATNNNLPKPSLGKN